MPVPPPPTSSSLEDLRLGHPALDGMHEDCVMAVDALLRVPEEAVAAALADLNRHMCEHFDSEERWMSETSFPARECHAREHAAVRQSIASVVRRVALGDLAAARTLGKALLDWLPGHIDYMDAALAHWLCKRRYGGTPVVLRRRQAAEAT